MSLKIQTREELAPQLAARRAAGKKVVFTNGCFDLLHVGHIDLLQRAKAMGHLLVVGLNSDASVRRLKGPNRPIHPQEARARVMAALECVDAVVFFEEDTPIETIEVLKPSIHVKGGDYRPEALPEAAAVQAAGGQVCIVPFLEGFSTTKALEKQAAAPQAEAVIVIPARYGSTRFPGKPLVELAGQTVISRVVRATLQTAASKPVLVATDDSRIAGEIETNFSPQEAVAVMTSPDCHTGTDRLAEAIREKFGEPEYRLVVVNVQGDEPFIEPEHIDALIALMNEDAGLQMATLATPILDKALEGDPNVVKAVVSKQGKALYFSRSSIPFDRDGRGATLHRHLGIYAYDSRWLLKMAALPPSPLEEIEKLEQLRAMENGTAIGIVIVENVVPIAIDTPQDLERAEAFLREKNA